jgi:hypothetical protein
MLVNQNRSRILLLCLLFLVCSFAVQAQSGRRNTPAGPPPPVPTPTPEPTPKPKEAEKEPDMILVVGVERGGAFVGYPLSYYDAALTGCAEALRKASAVSVDVSTRDLTRAEAIKKAKSHPKTYAVLLLLTGRVMSGSPTSELDQVELEFTVFAPTTAKVVAFGRSYQTAARKGPIVVGPTGGSTSRLYAEVLIKRAGEDAGERILRALHKTPGK